MELSDLANAREEIAELREQRAATAEILQCEVVAVALQNCHQLVGVAVESLTVVGDAGLEPFGVGVT